jgi:hypothetical protein
MSFKLVHQIKKSPMPAPMKRILEAYCSFANRDGTNVRASETHVGKRASCSRSTVSRWTQVLTAHNLLVHERNSDGTPKTHDYENGKWAYCYHINASALTDEKNQESWAVYQQDINEKRRIAATKNTKTKFQKNNQVAAKTSKMLQRGDEQFATNPHEQNATNANEQFGTQPYSTSTLGTENENPVPEKHDPSATSVAVETNKQANERDLPPPSVGKDECVEFSDRQIKLVKAVEPIPNNSGQELKNLVDGILDYLDTVGVDEHDLLAYNRIHKRGKLVIHTLQGFFNAIYKGNALLNDYMTHEPCDDCRHCPARYNKPAVWGKKVMDERRAEAKRDAEVRAWLESQHGRWDYTKPTPEVMEQLRAIVHRDGEKWVPQGVGFTNKLFGDIHHNGQETRLDDDMPEFWWAAVNRTVGDGRYITFEQFKKHVECAHAYKVLSEEMNNTSNMGFVAEEV